MNQLTSFAISSIIRLLALIPLKVIGPIAQFMAWILWASNSRSKKIIIENLQICFPEKTQSDRRKLAQKRMKHLCHTALELGAAWSWPVAKIIEHMEILENGCMLDELVAKGNGVILLVPHHGNWEMLGPYVGSKHKLVCLFQPPKIKAIGDLVYKSRSRFSAELASTSASGVRTILKALKRGEVVSILPDQVPPQGSGEFSPFFGVPALTMTLVYNLIQRTGASVAIGYAKRTNKNKHFEIVLKQVPQEIRSENQIESLHALNRCVEDVVMDCPEQYQWEYKRFKRHPDGKKFYL